MIAISGHLFASPTRGLATKGPRTCVYTTGPEVTIVQKLVRAVINNEVSTPGAKFALLASNDGACVDLWTFLSSLDGALFYELEEFLFAGALI